MTFESGILFDVDSDALRPAARQNLQNLANSLQKYRRTNVLLVGHTDSTGADSYNQALWNRRASSARVVSRIAGRDPSSRGDLRPWRDRTRGLERGRARPAAEPARRGGYFRQRAISRRGGKPRLMRLPAASAAGLKTRRYVYNSSTTQNTYFAANCMMRGSRIVVTRPNVGLLSAVTGSFGIAALNGLNTSQRASMRCVPSEKMRDSATSRFHVANPRTDEEVHVAVAAERRQRERGAIEVLRVQAAGVILVHVVEDLVGRLAPQARQRAIDAGRDGERRTGRWRGRAPRNASSTPRRSTRDRWNSGAFATTARLKIVAAIGLAVRAVAPAVERLVRVRDAGRHAVAHAARQRVVRVEVDTAERSAPRQSAGRGSSRCCRTGTRRCSRTAPRRRGAPGCSAPPTGAAHAAG